MSTNAKDIANIIAAVMRENDWTWETFRGVPLPFPIAPSAEMVEDYIARSVVSEVDQEDWNGSQCHPNGRIHLHRRWADEKVEVYLRVGVL
jgi:hypothetical protein